MNKYAVTNKISLCYTTIIYVLAIITYCTQRSTNDFKLTF